MNRPRIKIEPNKTDNLLELLGGIALILLIFLPIYYYKSLPEIIPRHFDFKGVPDAYGKKSIIVLYPAMGIILYLGLRGLLTIPHLFNYPMKINEGNAEAAYRIAVKMLRLLNVSIVHTMLFLTYATIKTALGEWEGVGNYSMLITMLVIFCIPIYSLLKMRKI